VLRGTGLWPVEQAHRPETCATQHKAIISTEQLGVRVILRTPTGSLRVPGRTGGQVRRQSVGGGVLDELPLVGEPAVVVPTELVQHQAPGLADAEWMFQQIDQRLGQQRHGFPGQWCGGEDREQLGNRGFHVQKALGGVVGPSPRPNLPPSLGSENVRSRFRGLTHGLDEVGSDSAAHPCGLLRIEARRHRDQSLCPWPHGECVRGLAPGPGKGGDGLLRFQTSRHRPQTSATAFGAVTLLGVWVRTAATSAASFGFRRPATIDRAFAQARTSDGFLPGMFRARASARLRAGP
jgi:hypothetical protein